MQGVHYSTYLYQNNTSNAYQTITIPIKNFSGLKVIVTGNNTNLLGNTVVFNNSVNLQPYICTLLQIATYPYVLDLPCNAGELDSTQITLKIPLGVTVEMIFKFYTS